MVTRAVPTTGTPVDWTVAARVGGGLVRPGPSVVPGEAADLVADLRRAAAVATGRVAEVTGIAVGPGPLSRVLVVDRRAWVRANTEMLASLTGGVPVHPGGRAPSAGTRLAGGVQLGSVLAALSGKVLGQFDPFSAQRPAVPDGPTRGRLLLVAPNVLAVERALRVDPADFRLWVALHEQTHALQFAAAPWLEDHLRGRMGALLVGLTEDQRPASRERARTAAAGAARVVRGEGGLTALLPAETQRLLEEVGAVMALLEGHADVAMDAVGRSVVPSVRQIRARFDRRRSGSHGVTAVVLRRLLGLDAKLAQYRDGARFVRRVRRAVGPDGLNAVWSAAANLPSPQEIAEPRAWVRRVHG